MAFIDEFNALLNRYSVEEIETALKGFKRFSSAVLVEKREIDRTQKQCFVYQSHTVDNKSFAEIAGLLNLTKERIRQIYNEHTRHLRYRKFATEHGRDLSGLRHVRYCTCTYAQDKDEQAKLYSDYLPAIPSEEQGARNE